MLSGDDLAILIPLWRRVDQIERVYDSARAATPQARIVWIVSYDDEPVRAAIADHARREIGNHTVCYMDGGGGERGDYARKINRGYRDSDEPFLFTGADDLDFRPGWYAAARHAADLANGPMGKAVVITEDGAWQSEDKPRIGVVGTNDLANPRTMRGDHSTHTLVARWYADDPGGPADQAGAIYHEGYWHEYCDDELVQTAKHRGAYAHALDAVVEHRHPIVGPYAGVVPDDDVYRHGRRRTALSRRLFVRRAHLWGGEQRQARILRGGPRR